MGMLLRGFKILCYIYWNHWIYGQDRGKYLVMKTWGINFYAQNEDTKF